MIRELVIVEPGNTRSFPGDALPLHIGTGTNANLRVPGVVDEQAIALIGALDGRLFLQPVASGRRVAVNGDPVGQTSWLASGDRVDIDDTQIQCVLDDDRWTLSVSRAELDYPTRPPELAEDSGAADDEPIAPVRMRRVSSAATAAPRRWRRLRLAGFAGLALLLAVALYLFTAKAVLIAVDPPAPAVQIAGGFLKPQFGERYLLWPGNYRVLLSAPGYESAREEILVTDAASQEFEFALRKLPGRLVVTTLPDVVAEVLVDDEAIGETPTAEVILEPGPHALRVDAPRFEVFETSVEIEGRDTLQTFQAELVPRWADVTITSLPPGAAILVDGELVGETPGTVEIMAGNRELVVQKEGFKRSRQTLAVVANRPVVVPEIQLEEADGTLTVTSVPSGAAVSVDGRFRGTTPIEAELSPGGSYEVIVSKAGFGTVKRQVTLESRRGKALRVELEPRVGVVTIKSEPADAELYVDGERRGVASQELSLPARAHRIEIRKPGLEPFVTTVTPKPGLPQMIEVKLLTREQTILAATPRTITTSQGATLRLVGPGRFEMGAPRREQGRRANETQRGVELTRRFYIALREVTNSQFREFKARHTSGAEKYRELAGGDHPVVMLGWEEAASFCNWLSDREGLPAAYAIDGARIVLKTPVTTGYRLPTEAEWAWVARYSAGGETRKYPWGNRMPPQGEAGNFADRSAEGILANVIGSYDDGYPVTAPVGRFAASPLGLFDIGGNAAEWVNDYYTVYPTGAGVAVDPVGPAEGQYHVIRGSGWRHASIGELRLAYRDFGDRGRLDVGFRIARYADETEPDAFN